MCDLLSTGGCSPIPRAALVKQSLYFCPCTDMSKWVRVGESLDGLPDFDDGNPGTSSMVGGVFAQWPLMSLSIIVELADGVIYSVFQA